MPKITDLPPVPGALTGTEPMPGVQSGTTYKFTTQAVADLAGASVSLQDAYDNGPLIVTSSPAVPVKVVGNFISGKSDNTIGVANTYCFIAGGSGGSITGNNSFIGAGVDGEAAGPASSVLCGERNRAEGFKSATLWGQDNIARGVNAGAGGNNTNANGNDSMAFGCFTYVRGAASFGWGDSETENRFVNGGNKFVTFSKGGRESYVNTSEETVYGDDFFLEDIGIASQGTGYTATDILNIIGGVGTIVAQITVDSIGGSGEILTSSISNPGNYSLLPDDFENGVSGGTGTGAKFNLLFDSLKKVVLKPGGVSTARTQPLNFERDIITAGFALTGSENGIHYVNQTGSTDYTVDVPLLGVNAFKLGSTLRFSSEKFSGGIAKITLDFASGVTVNELVSGGALTFTAQDPFTEYELKAIGTDVYTFGLINAAINTDSLADLSVLTTETGQVAPIYNRFRPNAQPTPAGAGPIGLTGSELIGMDLLHTLGGLLDVSLPLNTNTDYPINWSTSVTIVPPTPTTPSVVDLTAPAGVILNGVDGGKVQINLPYQRLTVVRKSATTWYATVTQIHLDERIRALTGTLTLAPSDNNTKLINSDDAGHTINLPAFNDTGFPIGGEVECELNPSSAAFLLTGIELVAPAGVTINNEDAAIIPINGHYQEFTLRKEALNSFILTKNSPFSAGPFAQIDDVTVASTALEVSFKGSGVGGTGVPANTLKVGDSFKAKVSGPIQTNGPGQTIQFKIKSGTVLFLDSGIINLNSIASNQWYEYEMEFTVRAIGVPGVAQIFSSADLSYIATAGGGTREGAGSNNLNALTFDTTVLNTLDLTVQWGLSHADNTITSRYFVINKVK